jgi:Flp pilus assembly CpaE family ATPase
VTTLETYTPPAAVEPAAARLVMTGDCDGLAELRDSIAAHPELDLRGWCEEIEDAAGLLGRGPAAVLHGTAGPELPEAELEAIGAYTDAPVVLVTPDESLRDRFAKVLVLPADADQVAGLVLGEREQATTTESRLFTVFSPKGGTGKSVISTNLGVALALNGVSTLLVDLGLELGDAALMLGSEPRRTIYDLVAAPGALDAEKLMGYATRHTSGLDVLPAPLRPEQAELVTEEKIGRILDVAKDAYEAVVVDAPPSFHGTVLAAIDRTDSLLVVCELDMATLKNVRVTLETLGLLRFPPERVSLVLNQPGPSRALKRSELEAALGSRVRFELPYDADVPAAIGLGKPVVLTGGGFAKAISKMAGELVPKKSTRSWSASAAPNSNGNHAKRRWPLRKG